MPYSAAQWKNTGLIPTSGLLAWHMYEMGASGHNIIFDYSGNNRTIDSAALNAPVLTSDVLYGLPGWYFDGVNTVPLNYTGAVTVKHAFVLAAHEDAAFNLNRGLLSGEASGDILASNNSGTKFFDLGIANHAYRKSDVGYALNAQEAPMNNVPELMEVTNSDGIALDGIQVGKQRNIAGRIWKGYFFEQMLFSRVLDATERKRLMLYFNLKFSQWRVGLPFYFPSQELMQFKASRVYAQPPMYEKITDSYEFEDAGKTFNEVADIPPRRWEYNYLSRTAEQTVIFDAFYDQARIANPFNLVITKRDGTSEEFSDVRVERYNRGHDKHMSWKNNVEFDLVKYP